MAVSGTIQSITVSGASAVFEIDDGSGVWKFFVWSDVAEDYSLNQRLIHGMWLSLLRDAMVNNLTVAIETSPPEFGTLVSDLLVHR